MKMKMKMKMKMRTKVCAVQCSARARGRKERPCFFLFFLDDSAYRRGWGKACTGCVRSIINLEKKQRFIDPP